MIKNNKILALKYRPQIFEDLIGQDIVADTILNSIKNNKIPNAYLFTGIRSWKNYNSKNYCKVTKLFKWN